jgi:hypothetical protein
MSTVRCYLDSTQKVPDQCKCQYTYTAFPQNGKNQHVFLVKGLYTVCLIAQNNQTGSPTEYLNLTVRVIP